MIPMMKRIATAFLCALASGSLAYAAPPSAPLAINTGGEADVMIIAGQSNSNGAGTAAPTIGSGVCTSGSTTITGASGFLSTDVGDVVTASCLPQGVTTIITAYNSATSITVSNQATATASGLTISVGRNPPDPLLGRAIPNVYFWRAQCGTGAPVYTWQQYIPGYNSDPINETCGLQQYGPSAGFALEWSNRNPGNRQLFVTEYSLYGSQLYDTSPVVGFLYPGDPTSSWNVAQSSGTGFSGTFTCTGSVVVSVNVTVAGTQYGLNGTTAHFVFSGGGVAGASADAVVNGSTGAVTGYTNLVGGSCTGNGTVTIYISQFWGVINPTNAGNINAALAALSAMGRTPKVVTVAYMQGESDGQATLLANAYNANLTALISGMRTYWPLDASTQILIGRISNSSHWTYGHTVRAAEAQVAAADGTRKIRMVDTDNAQLFSDTLHYDTVGMPVVGESFGKTYFDAQPLAPVVLPSTTSITQGEQPGNGTVLGAPTFTSGGVPNAVCDSPSPPSYLFIQPDTCALVVTNGAALTNASSPYTFTERASNGASTTSTAVTLNMTASGTITNVGGLWGEFDPSLSSFYTLASGNYSSIRDDRSSGNAFTQATAAKQPIQITFPGAATSKGMQFDGARVMAGGVPTTVFSASATFTGYINGTTLTVTSPITGPGTIWPLEAISCTGCTAGTYIASQVSGQPGQAGVYVVSASQTVASQTITIANANTDFTWEGEVYFPASPSAQTAGVIACISSGTTCVHSLTYNNQSGYLSIQYLGASNGASVAVATTTGQITNGSAHRIRYRKQAQTLQLFLDGTEITPTLATAPQAPIINHSIAAGNLLLGGAWTLSPTFVGTIGKNYWVVGNPSFPEVNYMDTTLAAWATN